MPQSAPILLGTALLTLTQCLSGCGGNPAGNGRQEQRSAAEREARPASGQPATRMPAPAEASVKRRFTGGPNRAGRMPNPAFASASYGTFNEPWAMTFLPDGRLLITEKPGQMLLFNTATRTSRAISGVPVVAYGGQGGLGDVVLHPQFDSNRYVYFSYAEADALNNYGAVVARAELTLDNNGGGSLDTAQILWRQTPKQQDDGHYSHRILFDQGGKLWITSGDRRAMTPAQNLSVNLGKVVRLNDDGTIPNDNPFFAQGGVAAQVWSYGHRNPLGIAMDPAGRIWANEMGPRHGDELNLIERGSNYGWPLVSNGDHYDGTPIPDHAPGDGYNAPEAWWSQTIAPSSFIVYSGDLFPYFRGNGFIGGLASRAIIRIQFDGTTAREAERYPMGARIREVEQGPDGAIWVLEDGSGARLLRLAPPSL
jgi:aldose sugar dehydrogenase